MSAYVNWLVAILGMLAAAGTHHLAFYRQDRNVLSFPVWWLASLSCRGDSERALSRCRDLAVFFYCCALFLLLVGIWEIANGGLSDRRGYAG